MNYVGTPNLPEKPVKLAVVDGRINAGIEEGLRRAGIAPVKTLEHAAIYKAVSYHPDMMLHHVGRENIVYAPGTPLELLDTLSGFGFKLIEGKTALAARYPWDIAYNAARVGNVVFHNLKYTDPVLMQALEGEGVEFVHVSQGYAKCSISVADEGSIITADRGIAKAAVRKGVDVLLVEPEKNILLPGLDHGFIGGSTGLIHKGMWAVAGNADTLESVHRIYDWLNKKGIVIVSLYNGPVMDIGSVLPLLTE